jgi:hypothetical protein
MKHNFNEKPPKKESSAQEIARIDAQLLALKRREQEILQLLSQEEVLAKETAPETELQTQEIEAENFSPEKNARFGEQLTQRLRQAGKTALVTAALSFGTGTTLHDSETPLPIEKAKEPAPKEISVTSKEKVSHKDSARTATYSPAVLEKIKDEPLVDAEKIIAERIENDPSIHERAMKFIENMDASLLNRLSTSAKVMYLRYIEDNISAVDSGMEPQYHFIIDKDYNYLTISDTKNKLVASTPVITGASFGNGLNNLGESTVDNKIVTTNNNTGKYTTPAGFWSISTENPDPHYGEYQRRVSIEGAEQNQNIMIHPGLKNLPPLDSARQRNAFFSDKPQDRKQSYGCIRVPHWFLRDYIHLFDHGTPLGISPEKDGEVEVYFDPKLAEMHRIGGEHWAESDYAAILRDIQKVQKERREAFKNKKK